MMKALNTRLLTDGSSDKVLLPIIDWSLRPYFTEGEYAPCQWVDPRILSAPSHTLDQRIRQALDLPCDILFIHRDAEGESLAARKQEIIQSFDAVTGNMEIRPRYVCVVPVRMQEAWLLFDLPAIRAAAGNPNGKNKLILPALKDIEAEPEPKKMLHQLLKEATEGGKRRKAQFNVHVAQHRLVDLIDDFSPLRQLSAFVEFEHDLSKLMEQLSQSEISTP